MTPVAGGAAAVAAASAAKAGLKAEAIAPRILAFNFGAYHSLDDLPKCQNLQVSKLLCVMFFVVCRNHTVLPLHLSVAFGSRFGVRIWN